MSSTFTLTDGQKTLTIYPEYDSKLGGHIDRTFHRIGNQTLKAYAWAVYQEYDLNVNNISEDDATTINDWWQRRVTLFFTHTVDGTVRTSQTCKLSGESLPLPKLHNYDITKRHGQLRIRVLDPITKPRQYSVFCGCESVGGSGGLFRIGSGDFRVGSCYIYMPLSDTYGPMTLDSSYTMVGSCSFRVPTGVAGAFQLIYDPDIWYNSINIMLNQYLKCTSGWMSHGYTLASSDYQLDLYVGGGSNNTDTIECDLRVNSQSIYITHYKMPIPIPYNQWATYNIKIDLKGKIWNMLINNVLCACGTMVEVASSTRTNMLSVIYVPYNTNSHAVFIDGIYQTANWNDNLFNIRTLVDYPL